MLAKLGQGWSWTGMGHNQSQEMRMQSRSATWVLGTQLLPLLSMPPWFCLGWGLQSDGEARIKSRHCDVRCQHQLSEKMCITLKIMEIMYCVYEEKSNERKSRSILLYGFYNMVN